MNIIEALQWRYATKKFDSERTLSNEQLELIKEAFNLTATSFGLQTIKMLIISDRKLREQLVEFSYHQKQVVEASHLLVICIQNDILDDDIDAHFNKVSEIRTTPETILEPYRNDLKAIMKGKTLTEKQEWSKRQAYIALGNLMTVCAVEHIDSCPMEGFVSEKYDEILNLQALNLKSVLLLPVGFRAQDDMFSELKKVRKDLGDAVLTL